MMMINTRTPCTPSPTWKLYENPFYTSPHNHHHIQENIHQLLPNHEHEHKHEHGHEQKELHLLHLPVSTRKIAATFWDLTFIKPFMDSEVETARAQIMELKAQVEYERKARKKAEALSKKLNKEVIGERKEREGLEKVCEGLACELTASKAAFTRLKMEMEEERRMLHVAEVLREERVQMKLSEAKFVLEEKMSELENCQNYTKMSCNMINEQEHEQEEPNEKSNVIGGNSVRLEGGRGSLEAENPHIKRGIRGFVEFPRVVRAIGSRSRHFGTKLECQKAQLMILLKQKTHPGKESYNELSLS